MSTALQKRRKELKSELVQIERQIYELETSYLEETRDFGNIFTGWEAYIAAPHSHNVQKIRKNILYEDRHFSLSSITSPASRKEENKQNKQAKEGSSTNNNTNKKRKKSEDNHNAQDEDNYDGAAESKFAHDD